MEKMTVNDKEQMYIPEEFSHFIKVMEFGAKKYGPNSWLKGEHFNVRSNQRSVQHHLLDSNLNIRLDPESGLDSLLHAITRLQFEYTLRSLGMIDEKTGNVKKDLPTNIEFILRSLSMGGSNKIELPTPQAYIQSRKHDWGFDVTKNTKDQQA
jgi:hypothetical protein